MHKQQAMYRFLLIGEGKCNVPHLVRKVWYIAFKVGSIVTTQVVFCQKTSLAGCKICVE